MNGNNNIPWQIKLIMAALAKANNDECIEMFTLAYKKAPAFFEEQFQAWFCGSLNEEQQETLKLSFRNGLNNAEIAREMNFKDTAAAKYRVDRSLQSLRHGGYSRSLRNLIRQPSLLLQGIIDGHPYGEELGKDEIIIAEKYGWVIVYGQINASGSHCRVFFRGALNCEIDCAMSDGNSDPVYIDDNGNAYLANGKNEPCCQHMQEHVRNQFRVWVNSKIDETGHQILSVCCDDDIGGKFFIVDPENSHIVRCAGLILSASEYKSRALMWPCSLGDIFYTANEFGEVSSHTVIGRYETASQKQFILSGHSDNKYSVDDIGNTVFFTSNEAAASVPEEKSELALKAEIFNAIPDFYSNCSDEYKIGDLFSQRTCSILRHVGTGSHRRTIFTLVRMPSKELLNVRGVGVNTQKDIVDGLRKLGFTEISPKYELWCDRDEDIPVKLFYKFDSSVFIKPWRAAIRESNVLLTQINHLGLSIRAYNCLCRAGIKDVFDIIKCPPDKLRKINNLGISYKEVVDALRGLGFEEVNATDEIYEARYAPHGELERVYYRRSDK